jgi:hypothetical protein
MSLPIFKYGLRRPAAARPSFLIFLFFFFSFLSPTSSLLLFLAGDLAQWHLPVGMKDLNLRFTKVTGKATSE